MKRRTFPPGKTLLAAFTLLPAVIFFAGCQTTSRKTKEQQRQEWEGRFSQQVLDQEDKLFELKAGLEALKRQQVALESRVSNLETEFGSAGERQQVQIDELRSALQASREAADKKIAIILEEVARENELLLGKIRASQGTGQMQGYEHVVKTGETLSEISRQYGTTVKAIVEANELANPDSLRTGQKLFIPQ